MSHLSDNTNRSVGTKDWLCRQFGRNTFLPRKLRATLIHWLVGVHSSDASRNFSVPFQGHVYHGSTGSHVDWFVYYFGVYDELGINFLKTLASRLDHPVFLDVGSNTGTHALALANFCHRVHCFEPFPKVLKSLEFHIQNNRLNHIAIHPVGLSDEDGIAGFYENKSGNLGAGTFVEDHSREPDFQLPLVNGDQYLEKNLEDLNKIQLIKLDVEGLEINAIRGLHACLARSSPTVLWEFNSTNLTRNRREILAEFPEGYRHFLLTFRSRWTRSEPRLTSIDRHDHGNFISMHSKNIYMIKDIVDTDL